MLGDFFIRILILLLGYAYPGFECYKTVEKNKVEIEELRFWCQYWIIVALLTVLEKFADILISWLPLYGEMKLGLYIYLWYPKTKGTGYIYRTVLRPYVSRHESEIDRKLMEWKARAWDIGIFYWQYCAQFGHSAFFQGLQYVASQSTRFGGQPTAQKDGHQQQKEEVEAETPAKRTSFFENKQVNLSSKSKKWPPSPPSSPSYTFHRNLSLTPKSRKAAQAQPNFRTEQLQENTTEPEAISIDSTDEYVKDHLYQARARLRRMNPDSPRTPSSPHL